MRLVLDTNVIVSGLLSPFGAPGRILDLVTSRSVTVLYDDRIIAEYREVLARPRLRIGTAEASGLLAFLERDGMLVSAPPVPVTLPDMDDLPFVEVAEAGAADALVNGNGRHFVPVQGRFATPLMSPAVFFDFWLARHGGRG
jgi:putative PIN family toxin of toxin-antitoxin system